MKSIIDFLEANGIQYKRETYGNPYYYNDGFTVPAVVVTFDYDLTEDQKALQKKQADFIKYMSRKKAYCIGYQGTSGIYIPWFAVFNAFDFKRQQEHEKRIRADVEKFWIEEHAKRQAATMAAAI